MRIVLSKRTFSRNLTALYIMLYKRRMRLSCLKVLP